MRSPFIARHAAALLVVLACLAHAGESVAHGLAHHREHEHQLDRDPGHHAAADWTRELEAAGHGREHPHGTIGDASVRARIDAQAIAATVELPTARVVQLAVSAPPARAPIAPGDPHTGPPPRLRAPPTC